MSTVQDQTGTDYGYKTVEDDTETVGTVVAGSGIRSGPWNTALSNACQSATAAPE